MNPGPSMTPIPIYVRRPGFVVSLPRRLVSPGNDEPLKTLTAPVEAPSAASPTLRYVSAASGGLPLTQVREAEAYAARASSELAFV